MLFRSRSDPSHDGDDDMFLNGERPRIKWDTEERNIRQVASPGLANWKTQQLGEKLYLAFSNWESNRIFKETFSQTELMVTGGYLKKKNWLTPGMRTAQTRPTTQARMVDDGIVGSSVLAIAQRTSGYGDSSSSTGAVGSKFGSSLSSTVTS